MNIEQNALDALRRMILFYRGQADNANELGLKDMSAYFRGFADGMYGAIGILQRYPE